MQVGYLPLGGTIVLPMLYAGRLKAQAWPRLTLPLLRVDDPGWALAAQLFSQAMRAPFALAMDAVIVAVPRVTPAG